MTDQLGELAVCEERSREAVVTTDRQLVLDAAAEENGEKT